MSQAAPPQKAAINWEQVRLRVRRNAEALQTALSETPQRIEEAFRARAARLAQSGLAPKVSTPGVPALVFAVAQERYAIELQDLAEVLPFNRCVRVPGAPPMFRGVMNVRGELRSVVDLGRLLTLSASSPGDSGFVLMLRRAGREIGLQVDSIHELREFRAEELDPPSHATYGKWFHVGTGVLVLAVDAVLNSVFSKQEPRSL